MNKVIAAAVIAASGLVAPSVALVATPALAAACTGDVPEEWRRPGGYCDQANGTTGQGVVITKDCVPLLIGEFLPEDFFLHEGMIILAGLPEVDSCGNPVPV